MKNVDEDKTKALIEEISKTRNADILFVSGELTRPNEIEFVKVITGRKRNPNVLLILVTPGGDADVAYKMARCLLQNYNKYVICVSGWCKSAGTLLAIGAHEIILSDFGELGPIDVQLGKADEIGEYSSGLDLEEALDSLEKRAFQMFMNFMMSMKKYMRPLTLKTACEISYHMMTNLLSPIYAKIDPLKIGDISRSINVARRYGQRLDMQAHNLKPKKLESLVSGYPDHGFVIDYVEASALFVNVSKPDEKLKELTESLGDGALIPNENGCCIEYLNEERGEDAANLSVVTAPELEQPEVIAETGARNRKVAGR